MFTEIVVGIMRCCLTVVILFRSYWLSYLRGGLMSGVVSACTTLTNDLSPHVNGSIRTVF